MIEISFVQSCFWIFKEYLKKAWNFLLCLIRLIIKASMFDFQISFSNDDGQCILWIKRRIYA